MHTPLHKETIMFLKETLAIAALTLATSASHAWTLVYANDASGNVTAGSLQTLRTALNNGSDLKVVVTAPNVNMWSVKCAFTSVTLDATQGVVCLSDAGLGVDISMGSNFAGTSNPPRSVHFAINTRGQYAQAEVNKGTGALASKTINNYAMQWFVD